MNKKFFTLLVALFAMIGFGAQAQNIGNVSSYTTGKNYLYEVTITDTKYYLAVDGAELVLVEADAVLANFGGLQKALWKATLTKGTGSQNPTVALTNEYSKAPLALSAPASGTEGTNELGGDLTPWIPQSDAISTAETGFYVYQKGGVKVWGLAAADGKVFVKEYATSATDIPLKFTPRTVTGEMPLSANDINTLLGTAGDYDDGIVATADSYFSLNTSPKNTQPSVFTKELQARALDLTGVELTSLLDVEKLETVTASYKDDEKEWVALYSKADKKYVVVDTAIYAGTDQLDRDLIKATVDDLYDEAKKQGKRLADSYLFRFSYNVENGAIQIESKAYINEAAEEEDDDNSLWAKTGLTTASERITTGYFLTYAQLVNEIVYTFGEESILISHITTGAQYVQTQVPTGVYILQVVDSKDESRIGKYAKYALDGTFEYVNKETRQNFQHIPAAQWVVVSTKNNTATFVNREYPGETANYDIFKGQTVTTYKTDKANQFFTLGGDVIEYTEVKDIKTKTLGYKNVAQDFAKQRFSFRYLHDLSMNNPVVINDNGLYVGAAEASPAEFELVPVKFEDEVYVDAYGATTTAIKDLVALERTPYTVRLNNLSLWGLSTDMYVAYDAANKKYILSEDDEDAVPFYLKENYEVDDEGVVSCYYVFVAVSLEEVEVEDDEFELVVTPRSKVAVNTNTLAWVFGNLSDITSSEVATSAFKVEEETYPLYRKLGDGSIEEEKEDINIVKFFRVNSNPNTPEYLYEDANSVYSAGKGLNFLGVEGKGDEAKAAMKVRFMEGKAMPQYLISLAETEVEDVEDIPCPIHGMDCIHAIKGSEGYTSGRFLVSLRDSLTTSDVANEKFLWEKKYLRLAFVEGKLTRDSVLHITSSAKTGDANVFDLKVNQHSPVLFQFRLLEEGSNDFLIESESWGEDGAYDGGIAPSAYYGGWVKIQNGVPVITGIEEEAYEQAEIFNLSLTDENPTSNKGIDAAQVDVVAGQGFVTIKGAAGQQVVVANILGQVIANVVLDSNEATIAAPAGVVVVSVNGAATKALVK